MCKCIRGSADEQCMVMLGQYYSSPCYVDVRVCVCMRECVFVLACERAACVRACVCVCVCVRACV